MNKIVLGVVVALVMVMSVGAASSQVLVAGKIYSADFSNVVSGAMVNVTCMDVAMGNTTLNTMSIEDGSYAATFNPGQCALNDGLSVHAFKEGVGENTVTGTVNIDMHPMLDLGIGVVNVPLVPEFGVIAAGITVLGAVAIFFFVRRK